MYAWTMAAGDFFTIHDKKYLRRFLYVVLLIPFDYNIDIISYAGHKKHVNGCWEELAV